MPDTRPPASRRRDGEGAQRSSELVGAQLRPGAANTPVSSASACAASAAGNARWTRRPRCSARCARPRPAGHRARQKHWICPSSPTAPWERLHRAERPVTRRLPQRGAWRTRRSRLWVQSGRRRLGSMLNCRASDRACKWQPPSCTSKRQWSAI